ncbi:MAG TPA: hypothetical protein VFO39_23480 [Candidatus Sulfotelmatobacter sp.]|nr:hypothetical protein [Candidatus Sulfotelmatobacter sp.]
MSAGTIRRLRKGFSTRIERSNSGLRAASLFIIAVFVLSAFSSAQTLTGTVKNATTGKPAAGDDVVLLKLGQGMDEAGRSKTDAKGNFSFKLDDAQSPHLVRAIHQGVTYHRMAPPGTTSVEVQVYDVGKKIEGIGVVADIMRIQAEQGRLEVLRMFAVQNNSKPPRTQMSERNLEFVVPEGAQVLQGSALTENGQPINSAPVPETGDKTRYSFVFPLRPGTTQFQVAYQLPYTGSANIDPKSLYPLQHFVAIMPKSMQFTAAPGTTYQSMNDPNQPDADVQVASGTAQGQTLAFKISGEGALQERREGNGSQGESAAGQTGGAQAESRPGGGLGPPIDAPDPLQRYRWWILGSIALALAGGGVYVASRQQAAVRAGAGGKARVIEDADADYEFAVPPLSRTKSDGSSAAGSQPVARPSSSSMLLEGLKEELFQLEVEHKQGHISDHEYEKTKAALDQTLQRALKREAARQT